MQFNIPAEHKRASGVYIIRNSINDKVYVGSTVNFWERFREHRRCLQKGKHHSYKLQLFVEKYSFDILIFELVEVIEEKTLRLVREQYWIDNLKASKSARGYNISPLATSTAGIVRRPEIYTKEYREKLGSAWKGRKHTHESRALQSAAKKGVKHEPWTEERKAAVKAKRKPETEQANLKRSLALRGRILSEETRTRMAEAAKSRKKPELSEEARANVLRGLQARLSPEAEARRLAGLAAYHERLRAAKHAASQPGSDDIPPSQAPS